MPAQRKKLPTALRARRGRGSPLGRDETVRPRDRARSRTLQDRPLNRETLSDRLTPLTIPQQTTQYARALVRRLTADLSVHDALRLARDIVTEVTNDIAIFEDEETAGRVDVALRRLIDRVETGLAD